VSEGYEGNTGTDGGQSSAGTSETASGHAGFPFRADVFRVSGFLRDRLRVRRAAPDGRIRHA